MIKFYNSLTKKKEEFKPIKKNEVSIYTCGPTVYNFVHIGNLRAYTFADILVRTLKYFNFKVNNVINLTDVDDKTIKGAKEEFHEHHEHPNQLLKKFTDKYRDYFFEDMDSLHLERPWIVVSATASIEEMEFLIAKLYDKGFAYVSDDGIYFDVSKAKDYGKLVNIDFASQKYNKDNRVVSDEYEKESAADFALWKFKKEENEPSWTIKVGGEEYEGRPGWHIECSAMSMKYLGDVFDIHTGGVDLKFPHHENEIAQSSCALGVSHQANYWMHNEHLLVDGKKMSKSKGNFHTLRDLEEKGYNPLALREVYLRSHYRQQLNFTFDSLQAGEANVKKINEFYTDIQNLKSSGVEDELQKTYDEKLDMFENALKDDLNTPVAISAVYEFIHEVNRKSRISENDLSLAKNFIEKVDKVLALIEKGEEIPKEIYEMAQDRKKARENKNFEKADEFRDKIKELGYEIKDSKESKEGYILRKLS